MAAQDPKRDRVSHFQKATSRAEYCERQKDPPILAAEKLLCEMPLEDRNISVLITDSGLGRQRMLNKDGPMKGDGRQEVSRS